MLGVNSKSHILPAHPRVKEIVASWGGGGGTADQGKDGGSHSMGQGSAGLEKRAGRWVSQRGGGCRARTGRKVNDNMVH